MAFVTLFNPKIYLIIVKGTFVGFVGKWDNLKSIGGSRTRNRWETSKELEETSKRVKNWRILVRIWSGSPACADSFHDLQRSTKRRACSTAQGNLVERRPAKNHHASFLSHARPGCSVEQPLQHIKNTIFFYQNCVDTSSLSSFFLRISNREPHLRPFSHTSIPYLTHS